MRPCDITQRVVSFHDSRHILHVCGTMSCSHTGIVLCMGTLFQRNCKIKWSNFQAQVAAKNVGVFLSDFETMLFSSALKIQNFQATAFSSVTLHLRSIGRFKNYLMASSSCDSSFLPRKLTVRTWKMMVGRVLSFVGWSLFKGLC